ncbi:MAG: TRAP transporter large permease subunit, partial [Clostridium sp.]|nr:TRAP transporter large permease subunit [Clostridium sp.]
MTLILFGTFFALVALGVPISYALGLSSITTIITCVKALSINVFVQRVFAGINSFPLMCIACFILSGELLSRGNLTERIVRAANVFVGRIPGGLAHVNVLASMLFGGISGSANADVSSLGPIEIEMMTKAGYHREFSVAVTVASATIGIIIPPSIPMVIYATSAGKVSIADMFLAGMIPGILVGLAMMITCFIIAKRRNYPKSEKKSIRENMMAILRGIPPCFLFVIILGGVLSGIFTP